jgi:hypothetical protein
LSDDLHNALIEMARQSKVQMEAEVHLGPVRQGLGEFVLTLTSSIPPRVDGVHMVDGRPTVSLVDGRRTSPQQVDPNQVDGFVTQWLTKPDYLPTRFRIVYPASMQELAERMARSVKDAAKRLGVGDFVDVTQSVVEADTEALYLGRWQAIAKGEVQYIDVQRGNRGQFTMSEGSESTGPAPKAPGRWSLAGRQIRIDKDPYTYQGFVNAEGNLLLTRRRANSQGDLVANLAEEPIIFKRVE